MFRSISRQLVVPAYLTLVPITGIAQTANPAHAPASHIRQWRNRAASGSGRHSHSSDQR